MIWTLKITLESGAYAEGNWECYLEIDSKSTLIDLHLAIQKAVNFDNDHLFEFFVANSINSYNRISFNDDNENILKTTIENIFPLQTGKKFFYLFDYGDSWEFRISKCRKKPFKPLENIKYPRIVKEVGKKPIQYPFWDEN
jgi:hypothetical protein